MRFTLLAQSLLVASAAAVPALSPAALYARDLASIQGALKTVQASLDKLGTAVDGVSAADANSLTTILSASTETQNSLQSATKTVSDSPVLSLTDALTLQQSATGLTASANKTINSLIAKKPVFDQLGVSSVVATQLQSQKTNSKSLGDAVVSKIPDIGKGIAQQSIDPINQGVDRAIAVYGPGAPAAAAPAAGAPTGGNSTAPAPAPVAAAPMPAAPAAVAEPAPAAAAPAAAPAAAAAAAAPAAAPAAAANPLGALIAPIMGILGPLTGAPKAAGEAQPAAAA